MLSLMPPLPARDNGGQPVVDWIEKECLVDRETAVKAFESAKQAKYLVMKPHEGKTCWHFDARSGYFHWHKPKPVKAKLAPLAKADSALIASLARAEPKTKEEVLSLAVSEWGNEPEARASLNRLFAHGLLTAEGVPTF